MLRLTRLALVALALGCCAHGAAAAACVETTTTTTVSYVETRTWVPGRWDRSDCRETYVPGHWEVVRTPTRVVDERRGWRRDEGRGPSRERGRDRDRDDRDDHERGRVVVIDTRPPVCIR